MFKIGVVLMVSLLARPTASQNTTALADALIPALLAGNSPNATSTILPLLDGRTVSGTSNITRISAPASDSSTTPNRTVTGLTTTDYDYIALLNQSYFFYEAQRSGVLPPTNRVPWRQNSRLTDAAPGGQPLVGGQYDAGDTLKLLFPYGSTTAMLAWGVLEFYNSYSASGNLQYALDQLRWAADFLITAHISPQEYVAQVGSAALDHSYWGRPEDESFAQPAYVIDPTKPSSDLLGEAAAGLAAVSAVFKTSDLAFSAQCLSEAQALYEFGTAYLGKYSAYGIDQLYPSSNFYDDLSYGAAWLYRATGQQNYLTDAENYWNQAHGADGNQYYLVFNWDNAIWGTSCLLSALQPGVTTRYSTEIEGFLASWINGNNGITVTPKGLAWTTDWGSLRNSANAALIAMIYSNQVTNITLATQYRCWAQGQIRYMLGDTGRSFVVGFGQDPPSHESHRAASCPYPPATCGWDVYSNPAPNAHVLFGALIGGPSVTDNFTDVRSNYEQNEPALDIQAGYTGVLAAMMAPSVPAWPTCQCLAVNNYNLAACGGVPNQVSPPAPVVTSTPLASSPPAVLAPPLTAAPLPSPPPVLPPPTTAGPVSPPPPSSPPVTPSPPITAAPITPSPSPPPPVAPSPPPPAPVAPPTITPAPAGASPTPSSPPMAPVTPTPAVPTPPPTPITAPPSPPAVGSPPVTTPPLPPTVPLSTPPPVSQVPSTPAIPTASPPIRPVPISPPPPPFHSSPVIPAASSLPPPQPYGSPSLSAAPPATFPPVSQVPGVPSIPTASPPIQPVPINPPPVPSYGSPGGSPAAISSPSPLPYGGIGIVSLYQQCGGRGAACAAYDCADDEFPSTQCVSGSACIRQNQWYRQCLPNGIGFTIPAASSPPPPQPSGSPSPPVAPSATFPPVSQVPGVPTIPTASPPIRPVPISPPPPPSYGSPAGSPAAISSPSLLPYGGIGIISLYQQCGGSGAACAAYDCVDEEFPGTQCVGGSTCIRQNQWYRQCLPNGTGFT